MKSKNILIVENKEQERKLFEYLVGQLHPFTSFDSGQAALSYLAEQPIHLILISLQLTDVEPLHFLQSVRQLKGNSCLIVALSSNLTAAQAPYFISHGFDEFLSKPVRPKEFILKLQELLEKLDEKVKNPTTPEIVPVVNTEVYQQLVRLSTTKVIRQVYADFGQECHTLCQLLDPNTEEAPSAEILRAIHTIKGNSGTLGAEKIYAAAKLSESYGRQQKIVDYADSLHYLKAVLVEFQEYLSKETSLRDA
jgi:CheY-like chemotaxis protein/HPt (histidine-containing phosphotransfer) domain-containing protein